MLTDTKGIFGFQQVVPVDQQVEAGARWARRSPRRSTRSAPLLTTDAIVAMNKAVQIDQKDPGVVAKAFLQANHLS